MANIIFLLISDILLFLILIVLINQRKRSAPETVSSAHYQTVSGERVLRHAVDLALPLEKTWDLFALSSGGFKPFLAPIADIQYTLGGVLESGQDHRYTDTPDHLLFEVTGYLPGELIVMRILNTPLGFPHPEIAKRLVIIIQLTALSSHKTRVAYSMVGWREGGVWNDFYDFFDYTNQLLLKNISEQARAAKD